MILKNISSNLRILVTGSRVNNIDVQRIPNSNTNPKLRRDTNIFLVKSVVNYFILLFKNFILIFIYEIYINSDVIPHLT